ncbi:uncharacterized protein LOC127001235 [Eriocheir sinensis]|uniref:uncharacterized protein LOC127001235 n=1 Tax=Eriocheir sinensis TaxID=95602 RepID=UPI0021C8C0D7|nr:uncharacterized protein LOC127001235 [Eriocheir sinensis]
MTGRVAVAAVLLLRLGGAHGTRDCKELHEVVVVSEGGKETICEERRETGRYSESTTVYVKPGDDFKGVSLEVTEKLFSAHLQKAWFGLNKCYSDNKWIKLKVNVEATNILNTILHFTLNIEGYKGRCTRKTTWNKFITGFSIVAHGSSNWTSTAKETGDRCQGPEEFTNLQNPNTCTDPPDPITTSTTSTPPPPVVIAVPIAVVVAVILAIVVCVTYRRRRRGQGEGQEIQYHPQSSPASPEIGSVHIMENSLYEPFPGPVTPAAREQQGTVVVENSLYEPLPGSLTAAAREQQEIEVVENSLYEPLPGSLTAAAREQQEIEVVENSLYEPFPASMTAPTNQ